MIRSVLLVTVGALGVRCGGAPTGTVNENDFRLAIAVGNATRTLEVHVPEGSSPAPRGLLLAFHGAGGNGTGFRSASGLDALADAMDLVAAYPDAAVSNWAEDCGCNNADRLQVDDTSFVAAVIDTLDARVSVDRDRIYAVGFSQGALFAQRLACQFAGRIAAFANVAGAMSVPLAEKCAPARGAPVMFVLGTFDVVFPIDGSGEGALALLGAAGVQERWIDLNGCAGDPEVTYEPDAANDGTVVRRESLSSCEDGSEVLLFVVEGGGHAWNQSADVATNALLLEFLSRHPG